jgi:hypothetical protein
MLVRPFRGAREFGGVDVQVALGRVDRGVSDDVNGDVNRHASTVFFSVEGEQSSSHRSIVLSMTAVRIDRTARYPRAGITRILMLPRYPFAVDDGSSPRRYRSPIWSM